MKALFWVKVKVAAVTCASAVAVSGVAGFGLHRLLAEERAAAPTPSAPVGTPEKTPVADEWPQWGQNAGHTFAAPGKEVRLPLKLVWKYDYGIRSGGCGARGLCPVIANGTVYLPYGNNSPLVALDGRTGAVKWRSPEKVCALATDGKIICGIRLKGYKYDAYVGVDAASGALKWTYAPQDVVARDFPGVSQLPVYAEGTFYGKSGGELVALDAQDGKVKWSYKPEGGCLTGPVVSKGVLHLVSGEPHRLYALEAATGKVIWSKPIDVKEAKFSPPEIARSENMVYVKVVNTLCLNAEDGSEVWRSAEGGGNSVLCVTPRAVIMNSWGGLTARDALTGKVLWHQASNPHCGPSSASNGIIWSRNCGKCLLALAPESGKELWRYDASQIRSCWPFMVANGMVYVQRKFVVLDKGTGKISESINCGIDAFEPAEK